MPRGVNDYDTARIQGRNVSNANSYSIVSPGLVTDGLVLHFDAGNFNSYPIAGTTWYDLSDSRTTGAITSGTYVRDGGGAIDLNASPAGYVRLPNADICNFTSQNFSFNIFFYLTSTTTNTAGQGPILFWKGNYRTNGYYAQVSQASPASLIFYTNQSGADQTSTSTANIVVGGWNNVCITRNGASVRIYINGVDSTSIAGTHSNPTSSTSVFRINEYLGVGTPIFGDVTYAILSSYVRALTPTEVEQNFNATRARFGV